MNSRGFKQLSCCPAHQLTWEGQMFALHMHPLRFVLAAFFLAASLSPVQATHFKTETEILTCAAFQVGCHTRSHIWATKTYGSSRTTFDGYELKRPQRGSHEVSENRDRDVAFYVVVARSDGLCPTTAIRSTCGFANVTGSFSHSRVI